MATVREVQAKLAATVTDTVLDRLGYREFSVFNPGNLQITPDPEVKFLSGYPRDLAYTDYLRQADAIDLPRDMVVVKINRHFVTYATVTALGRWRLNEKATGLNTNWDFVSLTQTDDRYIVTLILTHDFP